VRAALFLPGEGKYRDSIEAGYASMANFISHYPDPFGWNPFQYCGLPTHMWYLPGMPYLGALAIKLVPVLKPEHVYRLVATSMACLGPVTLFVLSYYFGRSRRWAVMAALLDTFSSVSYGLFQQISSDRGVTYLPWRMQVLTKYGEGPHNAGLMLLPLAMIACWRCALRRDYASLLLTAVLLAAVTLMNWIAAMALAWCVLMMLLAGMAGASNTGFLARRILAAAGLAYLLSCFWLTPRFIQTTLLNWPLDAFNYKVQVQQYALLGGLVVLAGTVFLLFRRFRGSDYLCWLSLCLVGFAWLVCNHYWFKIDAIPESRRYALEMEFFLALFCAELLRQSFAASRLRRELGIAGLAIIFSWAFLQVIPYVGSAWIMLRPKPKQETVEYQVAEFIHGRQPQGRVFVSGGTRFRLNSWFLIPQLGGTFESGLRIRLPVYLIYHLRTGLGRPVDARGRDAVRLLQFAGVEYVAIHGPGSQEHWKDIANPDMFEGLLERVYRNDGDAVYKVPFTGLAHLVYEKELPPRVPMGYDGGLAEAYVSATEDPSRPRLRTRWEGASTIHIDGSFPDGLLVSLQVVHDEGWRAWHDGRPLEVARDKVGYILLRPQPSSAGGIKLQYAGAREHKVFAAVSGLAWLAALAGLWRERRRRAWRP